MSMHMDPRSSTPSLRSTTTTTTTTTATTTTKTTATTTTAATKTPPSTAGPSSSSNAASLSRYESQKRRDWISFGQYLCSHQPPLTPSHCTEAHVLEFLMYLDKFGKTKVHTQMCPFFGHPNPPAPCHCPLRQAWGSLDALVGRLRAAYDENGGDPQVNPFGSVAVRHYLREVRDSQSKARGISYSKKKKNKDAAAAAAAAAGNNNKPLNHHEHHQPPVPPPWRQVVPAAANSSSTTASSFNIPPTRPS